MRKRLLSFVLLAAMASAAAAQHTFIVETKKPVTQIQPTMYGIFFEDINFGADGGLYAEMVANRSFEYPNHLQEWKVLGDVSVQDSKPAFERNPHYARLQRTGHGAKVTGIENHGYFGIGVKEGEKYKFSVYARKSTIQNEDGFLRVHLVNSRNEIMSEDTIRINTEGWKKYEGTLEATETDRNACLRILLASYDAVDLDHVSLFPSDAWQGVMRADLVKHLEDLHPGVFRFPGGCIVEGTDLATRYQWKNTMGPAENRPINENRWNYNFDYRPYPNYYQSYGVGFYEFFLLAEHLGAAPLPVISCGMACQFQNGGPDVTYYAKMDELQPYIDDALDLIEFANGAETTKWGQVRAEMGHPKPFGLKYLAVGNEQWDSLYFERLEAFSKQIREKYPDIKIIGGSGPYLGGEWFDDGWKEMRRQQVDLVDEHYYVGPDWFLHNANRYDKYDRKGPKVFAGEYAAHEGKFDEKTATGRNTFYAALCEAAFMTGLERNADVVYMATYAPLFAHTEGWQWRPDLIWYDNIESMRTPNYYVQQMYGMNKGTALLYLTEDGQQVEGKDGLYASAVFDKPSGDYIVKVANASDKDQNISVVFNGIKALGEGEATILHADVTAINTMERKDNVKPRTEKISAQGNKLDITIGPKTFAVYRLRK